MPWSSGDIIVEPPGGVNMEVEGYLSCFFPSVEERHLIGPLELRLTGGHNNAPSLQLYSVAVPCSSDIMSVIDGTRTRYVLVYTQASLLEKVMCHLCSLFAFTAGEPPTLLVISKHILL